MGNHRPEVLGKVSPLIYPLEAAEVSGHMERHKSVAIDI